VVGTIIIWDLFNDALISSESMTLGDTINKQRIKNYMEGSGCTAVMIAGFREQIWTRDLLNTKQKWHY
jgi:hypothetical protein